jgi:hypothetical protein
MSLTTREQARWLASSIITTIMAAATIGSQLAYEWEHDDLTQMQVFKAQWPFILLAPLLTGLACMSWAEWRKLQREHHDD